MNYRMQPVANWPTFTAEMRQAPTKGPLWVEVLTRVFKFPLRYLFILDPGLYITRTAWQAFTALTTMFLVGFAIGNWANIPGISAQFGVLTAGSYVVATTTSLRTYVHREFFKRSAVLYIATALSGLIALFTTFYVTLSTITFILLIALALWIVRYGSLGDVAAQCVINGYLLNMMLFQLTPNVPRWYAYTHAQIIGLLAVLAMVLVRSLLSINSGYRHVMYVQKSLFYTRREMCFFSARLLLYPDSGTWQFLRLLRGRCRRISLVADAVVSSQEHVPQNVGSAFHRVVFEIDMMVGSMVGITGRLARALERLRFIDVAPRSHRALVEWTATDLAAIFLAFEKHQYLPPEITKSRFEQASNHLRALEQALRLQPLTGNQEPKVDNNHWRGKSRESFPVDMSPEELLNAREENLQTLVRSAHRLTKLLSEFGELLHDAVTTSEAAYAHRNVRVTKHFTTGVRYANYAPAGKQHLAEQSARREKLGIIILHLNNRALLQGIVAVLIATFISYSIDPAHFYWGTIGAYLMMRGTSVRSDSYRKVVNRLIGTALGGAVGIMIPLLLGKWHAVIQVGMLIFVLSLSSGLLTISHLWFTTCITIAFIQLYSFFQPEALLSIIVQRMILNGSGSLVGALVASFLFPVRSGEVIRTGIENLVMSVKAFLNELALTMTESEKAQITMKARQVQSAVDQIEEIVQSVIRTPRNARRTSAHQNVLATLRLVQARCDMLAFLVQQHVVIPSVLIDAENLTPEERKRLMVELNSPREDAQRPAQDVLVSELDQLERLKSLKVDLALNQQIRKMCENLPLILKAYETDEKNEPQQWPRVAPALDDLARYVENNVRNPGGALDFLEELSLLDDALGSLTRQAIRL